MENRFSSAKDYAQFIINKSYRFSIDVVKFVSLHKKECWELRSIFDQLIRAATSIGANIVEAQAASSKKDFINFLLHALKSANETRYWIGLISETGLVKDTNLSLLLSEARELSRLLGASTSKLKKKS